MLKELLVVMFYCSLKAVESPTAQEICDILQHAGLNCDINVRSYNVNMSIRMS